MVCPTAAGPGKDSSYSELEQEGPQKLIHKVSTSEQMGTKVRLGRGPVRGLWAEGMLWEIPGSGIQKSGAGGRGAAWMGRGLAQRTGRCSRDSRGVLKRYLRCVLEHLSSHHSKHLEARLEPGGEIPPRKLKGSLVVHP